MKATGDPKVDRTETPETTNTALRIILRDLDVLVRWAEADEYAGRQSGALMEELNAHAVRARTYRQCRDQLARAFK